MASDSIYISFNPNEAPVGERGERLNLTRWRRWRVKVRINSVDVDVPQSIEDPGAESIYNPNSGLFSSFAIKSADATNSRSQSLDQQFRRELTDDEDSLERYGIDLARAIQLDVLRARYESAFQRGTTRCKIFITEIEPSKEHFSTKGTSIHTLRWELLEGLQLSDRWPKGYRISVSRVIDFKERVSGLYDEELSEVKRQGHDIKILVVVARNLTRTGVNRDAEPNLALSSLITSRFGSHAVKSGVLLEVVRPGSLAALKDHLSKRDNETFNIVHFDMHGDE
jgi:hypothetical protein